MSSPSTDEFRRRRGRRTGAAAVAAAYSGDQRQATPPFPSVCRLVEKYTMLIERHRQNQQNGSKAPAVRGKPSPPSSSSSSSTTVPPQPKQLSSSTVSDEDAAAWNHLLMDGGGGRKNKNDRVDGNGRRDVDTYGCYDDDYDYDDDDDDGCGRRFSSVSLSSIQPGSDEDEKLTTNSEGGCSAENARSQLQVVVSRLEVSKTKVKRKRRKSWTGPVGWQGPGDGTGGPCRKGHSLDQGYETTRHHHQQRDLEGRLLHQQPLYRSFSNNADGDAGTVVFNGYDPTDGAAPVNGGAGRQFRTPSVVVSDHSEDPVSFSSMFTLDDLGELEYRPSAGDCGFNDSSSDCSVASTWSASGSVISVLDADYSLHTPERKISGCSTCSTFSGGEFDDAAAATAEAFGQTKPRPKVSENITLFYTKRMLYIYST